MELPFSSCESIEKLSQKSNSYRRTCRKCQRASSVCICTFLPVPKLCTSFHVWLLTHPSELKHPAIKRTGLLCQLSLKNCTTVVGRDFKDCLELVQVLETELCFLLYPAPEARILAKGGADYLEERRGNLIVLDGTWQYAKQLHNRNANLFKKCKKVKLKSEKGGDFSVRKPPKEGYLSTLEAVTRALEILNPAEFCESSESKLLKPMKQQVVLWRQFADNFPHRN